MGTLRDTKMCKKLTIAFMGRPVTPGKVLEAHMIRSGYEGEKVASVLPCGYADWLNSGDPGNVIVVPIVFDETKPIDEKYLKRMFDRTEGLLLPGGADNLRTSHLAKITRLFMKWGKELVDNNKGYYPIYGICMGIEFFALNAFDNGKDPETAEQEAIRATLERDTPEIKSEEEMKNRLNEEDFTKWLRDAEKYPLGHTEGTFHTPAYMNYYNEDKSLILSQLPRTRLTKLKGEKGKQIKSRMPFGYLGNKLCVPKKILDKNPQFVENGWVLVATAHNNHCPDEPEFATLLENPKYGWIGVQPHLEKAEFEFNRKSFNLPERCVLLSRDVAKIFLNECRKGLEFKKKSPGFDQFSHEMVDLFKQRKKEIKMRDYYAIWMFERGCDILNP